jgi:hypothetical protein
MGNNLGMMRQLGVIPRPGESVEPSHLSAISRSIPSPTPDVRARKLNLGVVPTCAGPDEGGRSESPTHVE